MACYPAGYSVASLNLHRAFRQIGFFPLSYGFWLHSKKPVGDESINLGPVCAHMHSVSWAQKTLTFMSTMVKCQQQKHTQHAPCMKTECDYLYDKDPDIHIHDEWMLEAKTHPACTIHKDGMRLSLWLDWQDVSYATISPKMVNSRDIAGNGDKNEEEDQHWCCFEGNLCRLPRHGADCIRAFLGAIVPSWAETGNHKQDA